MSFIKQLFIIASLLGIAFCQFPPQSIPGPDEDFVCNRTFTGKFALITGGSNGMGWAAAKKMADNGIKVWNMDYRKQNTYPGVTHLDVDIKDDKAVDKALAKMQKETGIIDYLILNAGEGSTTLVKDMSHSELREFFDNNFISHAALFAKTRDMMPRSNDSRIILTSSLGAEIVLPYIVGIYGLTKSLQLDFGRLIATEYDGFKVSVIRPDGVNTTYWKHVSHSQIKSCPEQVRLVDLFQKSSLNAATTQPSMYGELVMQIICEEDPYGVYTMSTTIDEPTIQFFHDLYGSSFKTFSDFWRSATVGQVFDPNMCLPVPAASQ